MIVSQSSCIRTKAEGLLILATKPLLHIPLTARISKREFRKEIQPECSVIYPLWIKLFSYVQSDSPLTKDNTNRIYKSNILESYILFAIFSSNSVSLSTERFAVHLSVTRIIWLHHAPQVFLFRSVRSLNVPLFMWKDPTRLTQSTRIYPTALVSYTMRSLSAQPGKWIGNLVCQGR